MIIVVLVLAALVALALDRAYRRRPYPRARLAGSFDVADRDTQRLRADLVADETHFPAATASRASRRAWTKILPGTHSPA